MTRAKSAKVIFWVAVTILALAFIAQHLTDDKSWLVFLDDVHWTTANIAAAALAGLGLAAAGNATERAARRWFFIGLTSYAIGQLLWDIQVYIGWNPFPAPSDFFYLMLGPGCLIGLAAAIRRLLPRQNFVITVLDTFILVIAVLALTLTVYLPRSANIDLFTLSVMTAYPVLLISAAGFGLLMMLHVRPRADWPWMLFQVGLGLQGLIWMWWNVQALSGSTVDGSFLNEFFSVPSIVLGVAAMNWSMATSDNKRYQIWCEGLLRMLPILAVVMAALAAVLVLSSRDLLPMLRNMVVFSALAVILLAAIRQGLMLEEHRKLLETEQGLRESEQKFRQLMDSAVDAVFVADPRTERWLYVNERFKILLGYSDEDLLIANIFDIVTPAYRDIYREIFHGIVNSGGVSNREMQMNRKDGSRVPLEMNAVTLLDGTVYGSCRDITERKKNAEAQRIAAVTFDTQEAIMITTPDANILRVNQAFQDITGYSADDIVGQNPRILQSGRHDAAFYQAMWSALLNTGKWSGEVWDRRKDGSTYPKLMTITAVYDNNRRITHYVAVFRDITNRKKSEQEIHQLAFYDPLTKLPNRRLLLDRLQQALAVSARNGRYGALLFLDLDHFKTINDTQGHAMGDLPLVEVARRLQTCVREGDSVARLGGDEFVVLLEELSSEADEAASQTESVAEKVRTELDKPYTLNEFECLSTVSVGISLYFNHRESAEDLLMHADVAMYQAKMGGRNAIRFFDPQMQSALEMRAALEGDLRLAMKKQQFRLYYQVQVNHLRHPLGAEVLLRWEHPERGLVSPMEFIPLAEETGLIVPIGLWVLHTACTQLKKWQGHAQTRELTLAVNVSARQFRQPDFVEQVQRVLLETGAKPSHLKLELTESTVLENVEDTIAKMRELKLAGVGFSMDDFGTGYSSLLYLKRLPLDQIKIDQSFVRDIATDPNDAAIVQTIIAMSDALGLNVIAEGVETEVQHEFISNRGCHAFQGYLFGRPVPLAQFESALRQMKFIDTE